MIIYERKKALCLNFKNKVDTNPQLVIKEGEDGSVVLDVDGQQATLPAYTADDANKSLVVNADGSALEWGNGGSDVPTIESIDLSCNADFVLTATATMSDGSTVSGTTVDLPIESVVVNAEYDAENKEIVLTLQNGNTVSVPVGDLVNGLQREITEDNKLDANLVNGISEEVQDALDAKAEVSDIPTKISDIENDADFQTKDDVNNAVGDVKAEIEAGIELALESKADKNDIPTVPTNISAFTNDAGYQVAADVEAAVADKADKSSLDEKLNILSKVDDPDDPGYGWEYHIPYGFEFGADAEKITLGIKTLTLDNNETKMTFENVIPGATSESAGLMTAADKVALSEKVSAEYVGEKVEEAFALVEPMLATKVEKELVGSNGTATIFNERDGGGARFVHNDGTESFIGVNDGGEDGMVAQIYADKAIDGGWIGSRVNVYHKGIFYVSKDAQEAGSAKDAADREIAVKGDIPDVREFTTLGEVEAAINAAVGSCEAGLNKKVDKKLVGANGISEIFNERDGGGVKFTDNEGAASYVGAHDNIGGVSGIQIYADKDAAGSESTIIDITKNGAYYNKGEIKSGTERDVEANEIAVKGDIPEIFSHMPTADGTYTLKLTINGGVPSFEWVAAE